MLGKEGFAKLPGSDGRVCPIPVDGLVAGNPVLGTLTDGRLGKDGREDNPGCDGRVEGLLTFGRFVPTPPNEGREPPIDAFPMEFPDGRETGGRFMELPNDGRDMFGLETFGRAMLLGLDIFGRTPPPPTFPNDGRAPCPLACTLRQVMAIAIAITTALFVDRIKKCSVFMSVP